MVDLGTNASAWIGLFNENITPKICTCNCNAVYPFCEWYWMVTFGVVAIANLYLLAMKIMEKRRKLNGG